MVRIICSVSTIPARLADLNLEEDYSKIEQLAATHLENLKLQALVKKWREEVHIEIRMTE